MAFQTKSSRFALVREVTEGTPVAPTAGTQYMAVQDGYNIEPGTKNLQNAELTGSLGEAKEIIGLEEPKGQLKHYLRHSGVEGQQPDYGLLLEAALGDKTVNATEYSTVAGSSAGTASARGFLRMNTGIGANFEVGQTVLIKSALGYEIRNIYSISGDDLLLDFNLNNAAPASGTGLGKCVLYKPGTSHPTMTAWDFRANNGAVQMTAGNRVTSLGVEFKAGQLVNATFDFGGISYYLNPIEIKSTDQYLDFTDDAGTFAAIIATGFYKSPIDLARAIQTAIDAVTTTTPTVTYSNTTGKFTIKTTGTVLSLLWNTGTNTANTIGDKIGFSTAADSTGTAATTGYTSATAQVLSSPQSPSFDSANPLVAKNNHVLMGGFADNLCIGAKSVQLKIDNTKVNIEDVCAASGVSGSVITGRKVSLDIVVTLKQFQADYFDRYINGTVTQFSYQFGSKLGGNWTVANSGSVASPTATINGFKIGDDSGLVTMQLSVKPYVQSGAGEIYVGLV